MWWLLRTCQRSAECLPSLSSWAAAAESPTAHEQPISCLHPGFLHPAPAFPSDFVEPLGTMRCLFKQACLDGECGRDGLS